MEFLSNPEIMRLAEQNAIERSKQFDLSEISVLPYDLYKAAYAVSLDVPRFPYGGKGKKNNLSKKFANEFTQSDFLQALNDWIDSFIDQVRSLPIDQIQNVLKQAGIPSSGRNTSDQNLYIAYVLSTVIKRKIEAYSSNKQLFFNDLIIILS